MKLTPTEILNIFFHRKDVFAKQTNKGAYFPERRHITIKDIESHLKGEVTIGAYCLETDNTIKWTCVDLDIKKHCKFCDSERTYIDEYEWVCNDCHKKEHDDNLFLFKKEALKVFDEFKGFRRMLEYTGRKGYHIWIFFKTPVSADYAKTLVRARLNKIGVSGHEIFPKQTELNETRRFGNLVKIPFAKHKVSGQYSKVLKIGGWNNGNKT